MPTAVLNVPFHSTTNDALRIWGRAVSDGFVAVGMVKTSDTGQIDWDTAIAPNSANRVVGYEMFRFNDALQDSAPIFLKIEYGDGSYAGNPAFWITICRRTDGAGGAVDILAPRRRSDSATSLNQSGATVPTSIEPIYISSDGSSLCFSARIGATMNLSFRSPAFVIDRSRDATGNPTAAGGAIIVEGMGPITFVPNGADVMSAQVHAWTFSGESIMGDVPAVAPTRINTVVLNASSSLSHNDRAPVFPYIIVIPGHAPWQMLAACGVVASDAANGPFTANVLGAVRTYRSIPIGDAHQRWMAGGATGHTGLCILWEE